MPRKTAKPPKAPENTCRNCAYWLCEPSDTEMEGAIGECRKNPPQVFYEPELGLGSAWPPTDDTDRCGQWIARLNS